MSYKAFMSKQKGQDLRKTLEKAQEGFAYQMLALEIELEQNQSDSHFQTESLSRLLQLYMIAVECLQSKSDPRYKYFSNKIQLLMKKRVVLEEMNKGKNRKLDSDLLLEARKKELGERKEEYDMQMYLSSEINQKKVKELVDIAENKLKRYQNKIQSNIHNQDKELEERIKRRKMRSEVGSVEKFKMYKGKVVDRNLVGQKGDDYFQEALNVKVGLSQSPPPHQKHRSLRPYQFI